MTRRSSLGPRQRTLDLGFVRLLLDLALPTLAGRRFYCWLHGHAFSELTTPVRCGRCARRGWPT